MLSNFIAMFVAVMAVAIVLMGAALHGGKSGKSRRLAKARRRRPEEPPSAQRVQSGTRQAEAEAAADVAAAPKVRSRRSPAEQLERVSMSSFSAQPLLSEKEARVAAAAERLLADLAPGWRICPQVALGEAVRTSCKSAYWTVNAKRCDMLIVDEKWLPVAAIEYQGSGHHKGDAAVRDAVKKEALRRAGIGYIEICEGDDLRDLKRAIEKLAGGERLQRAA